jgi:hypothetical protein
MRHCPLLACCLLIACGHDWDTFLGQSNTPQGAGGYPAATGGSPVAPATGGLDGWGGATDWPGPPELGGSGGTTGSGGNVSSGGLPSAGGTFGSGGASASGGTPNTGGTASGGSSPAGGTGGVAPVPAVFAVDDLYTYGPVGCFSDAVKANVATNSGCLSRPPGAVGSCWVIDYTPVLPPSRGYGGCGWVNAATLAGATSVALPRGATRVAFYAAASEEGRVAKFFVGVGGDSLRQEISVALTTTLTRYTIDVEPDGTDYPSAMIAGFGWVMNSEPTPGRLYIDDVRWE